MVSLSTLVGTIPEQEPELFKTTDKGEKFIKLKASFNGTRVPIVVSEYVWEETAGFGRVMVKGYLDKVKNTSGRYTTFIYVHSITCVDENLPESNNIELFARITKKGQLSTTVKGVDVRNFVTTQTTAEGRTVIIYVEARGDMARSMSSYEKDQYIKLTGNLIKEKGLYSVVLYNQPRNQGGNL